MSSFRRHVYGKLYEEISCVAETAADVSSRNGRLRAVRQLACRFLDFHRRLQDHGAQENELIATDDNVDIGVGD